MITWLKKIRKFDLNIGILLISSTILRIINLGYSDYQGDEIKAFFILEPGQTVAEFLLNQRKGPVQFFITYLLKPLSANFDDQFILRLPFAIAGILSVFFFYLLLKDIFNNKLAFYAAFFLSTNGFFVAFSGIVQYQSFVILFAVLALYSLNAASKREKLAIPGLFFGFLFWALSILSHYDGIFIAPAVVYFIYNWFKLSDLKTPRKLVLIGITALIPLALLLSFYIPFVLNISETTTAYWEGRLSGAVSAKISSSNYLFSVYQPIYVLHIYRILFVIGFVGLFYTSIRKCLSGIAAKTYKLLRLADDFLLTDFSPLIIVTLFVWFGLAFLFWEKLVYIPGTHIYNYLIPMVVIMSFGIVVLEKLTARFFKFKQVKKLILIPIAIVFIFIFLQSFAVFVENNTEYPWHEERFYWWTFNKPTPIFHLSMFGFPYYRDWEGIRTFIHQNNDIDAYSTNERKSIARYYIKLQKDTAQAGYFVFIKNPQSFENKVLSDKAAYWVNKYPPKHTFSRNGQDLVAIYIMPVGQLDEIISQGY